MILVPRPNFDLIIRYLDSRVLTAHNTLIFTRYSSVNLTYNFNRSQIISPGERNRMVLANFLYEY